ncbi:alpha-E domain-containing protein [Thalassolituus sp. LLYu03]|uniref:alpha-E domain-containing protein n=1 Tax=Thalassolituus sp. LLYu03 TaxID=3421656 RepID=UPI003D28CD17
MLSKVAERIYWAARYLERAESTARILTIYDQLLFDLPRQVNLGWYNLIVINSLEADFNERYSVKDERNVVKFLLGDESNPSSLVSSLKAVRENIRTTRDVIPPETWEMVNELTLYVQENIAKGINRSARHEFLDNIIKGCQQIVGLWFVNMPRDAAWEMLLLGQNLERADSTTRNLDAGVAAILQVEDDDFAVNARQIIWGNVLRSLNAEQPFRRASRASVKGELVVNYLIADEFFPRSLYYSVSELLHVSSHLPHSKAVVARLKSMQEEIPACAEPEELGNEFRDMLNNLQITLGELHALFSKTWFMAEPL